MLLLIDACAFRTRADYAEALITRRHKIVFARHEGALAACSIASEKMFLAVLSRRFNTQHRALEWPR